MTTLAELPEVKPVGRKKPASPEPEPEPVPVAKRKQYNVGLPPDMAQAVEDTAKGLGLDEVNFLRLVIKECLPIYQDRVRAIRGGKSPHTDQRLPQ